MLGASQGLRMCTSSRSTRSNSLNWRGSAILPPGFIGNLHVFLLQGGWGWWTGLPLQVKASRELCSGFCTLDLNKSGSILSAEVCPWLRGVLTSDWDQIQLLNSYLISGLPSRIRNDEIFLFTSTANTAKNRTLSRKCEIGRKHKVECCFFRVAWGWHWILPFSSGLGYDVWKLRRLC